MKFNLKRPCAQCPFRSDIHPFLTEGRVEEITRQVIDEEKTFTCHKTLDKPRIDQSHCAGALLMVECAGKPHQMIQIAERLGLYNPAELDRDAPVYATATQMIKAQSR